MQVVLDNFQRAIESLREALEVEKSSISRDAAIQRFEFCVELSWKSSKKVMGTTTSAPKQVIREMAQSGFIEDVDLWLDAIENRNLSSHTYNEDLAEKVYWFAEGFLPEFDSLVKKLLSSS